jgi:hypothetical protein
MQSDIKFSNHFHLFLSKIFSPGERTVDGFEQTSVGQLDRTKRTKSTITSVDNTKPQADIIDMSQSL